MKIATHNQNFHADDVFGVVMLKSIFPASIVRTRDMSEIAKCDFAVDVGGVDDQIKNRFDHHQAGGAGQRENGTPYASSGLVWKAYGRQIVEAKTGDAENAEEVASRVDQSIISVIDAIDCGVDGIYKGAASVSSLIEAFNPDWRDDNPDFNAAFEKACELATSVLDNFIRRSHAAVSARTHVENSITHCDGQIVELLRSCPWKGLIDDTHPEAIYVIFSDNSGSWRVQAVPIEAGRFPTKRPLPKSWAGLNDEALDKVTGLDGSIFCHNGRFIAGHKTRDGALSMAKIALLNR